nr:coat protein [Gaeumannomyces tritici partitivirus 3]
MSTTKAFEIPTSVKAAAIKRRFQPATEQPKGAPSPTVKDDLISRIGTDRKHDASDGLPVTIDCQPDFRWIFMALMYYSNLYYSTIDVKNKSKTSPMTVCMYFLVIINAHMLVSDLFLRHTPSHWANQFMNDSSRRDYLEFLLALPVPDFLMKFIETLTETKDPRRPLVSTCPSFAGFSYYHDFGRYFPPALFLQAHTLAATVSARGDTDSVLGKLFDSNAWNAVKIGQLLGQHINASANVLDYSSKLIQAFYSMYNPVVERSLQRRNSFAPTPCTPYEENTKETFNPYICFLHATDSDITEMTTVLESVSNALSTVVTFKGQLGSLYDSLNGLDILRHGYSSYALPTWHHASVGLPTRTKAIKVQNAKERASTLVFLQTFTPANANDLKYPTDESTIDKIMYLVKKVTKSDNFPDPDADYRYFSPRYDVSPRLRVLDPYNDSVSTLSSVVYCGLIIESFEVDGSIVLHPDVDSTLDECNSQVLQSAVPLAIIRRATTIAATEATSRTDALQRVQHVHTSQKASVSLIDAGEHRLGVFDLKADEALPSELPSFRIREHTSWFSRMYNIISYKTTSPEAASDDTNPRVANGRLIAWSPYRFVSQSWKTNAQASHTFMITNMRTNYGMNIPLFEIAHPNDLLPIN